MNFSGSVILSMAVLLAFLMPSLACAEEKIDRLTDENITAFILETTEITAGHRADMSPEQVIEYLDRHIDKKAFFKSVMRYSMPDYPAQETAMNLDKKDFLKSVAAGSKSVSDYETQIEIRSIKISKDGTKATVETTNSEQATMPIEIEGHAADVPVEGLSNCLQILILSDEGVIEMHNANCTTEISLSPF